MTHTHTESLNSHLDRVLGELPDDAIKADTSSDVTLETFRASRREIASIGQALGDASLMSVAGFIYCDCLYIEKTPDSLMLYIEREAFEEPQTPEGLATLEQILFDWANGEVFNVQP